MTIDYLPWNRPAMLADRVCMRDTNVELSYAKVACRVDAVAASTCTPVKCPIRAGGGAGTWSGSRLS